MEIFSAQKNRSTTAPSLMSPVTRNFHLEVFVKQMFANFSDSQTDRDISNSTFCRRYGLVEVCVYPPQKPTISRDPFECPGCCIYLSQSFEA